MEAAAARQMREVGWGAGDTRELAVLAVHRRERVEQPERVGVARRFVERTGAGPLDQTARVHDDDLVRQFDQQREVVRDEDHREAEPGAQIGSSLRISRWVTTSRAVVGSSMMTSCGSRARARAIMMRWRWPPESSWGKRWQTVLVRVRPARATRRPARDDRTWTSHADAP